MSEPTNEISAPFRLSVIITTHNSKDWTERAVRSILSQTAPVGTEIVIVDDGSTDETLSHLKTQFFFEAKQGRLKLSETDRCGDQGKLKNLGAARSTGSFLSFLASTDWWRPGRLEALEPARHRHDLVFFTPQASMQSHDWIRALIADPWVLSSATVIRRSLFEEIGGFPEGYSGRILPRKIPGLEDYELWIRALATLVKEGKRERLLISKNEHVVSETHPKQLTPFHEQLKLIKQIISLFHVAPELPWKYWPEIARGVAETGRNWVKKWRL